MLFNSGIFVFLFFPVVLILYYSLHRINKHKFAHALLVIASFVFYGYNHVGYLVLLISSILINYGASCLIRTRKPKKLFTSLAVIANLGLLFYFKYFDFFLANCNSIFHTDFAMRNIILPLGISFFTFQQISFIIDTYKEEMPKYSFLEYALFVSIFPQLVAGPIVLHNEIIPQFHDPLRYKIDWNRFADGIKYFIIGLSKKTLLADSFAHIVTSGYVDNMNWDSTAAILIVLGYTFQIYFDFSGYSDMVIGLGKMMGFEFPKNFDMPYKAKNPAVFWRRWHMSLLRFLTKYVYIPLGGNRKGAIRTYINTIIVFLLSGIWHGAGWTFIMWGLLSGISIVFYRIFRNIIDKIPSFITVFCNFIYLSLAWVVFRAAYLSQAVSLFKCLFKFKWNASAYTLCDAFAHGNSDTTSLVLTIIAFIFTAIIIFAMPSSHQIVEKSCYHEDELINKSTPASLWQVKIINKLGALYYGILFALCVLSFTNISTFIYFNF